MACISWDICIEEQICKEWYLDGSIYKTECGDWYNTGDCYTEMYCGEVNEGGGGTAADDGCEVYGTCNTCVTECESNPTFLSDDAVIGSETISISVTDIDGFKKYKRLKWCPLDNLTWNLLSLEEGIVELVEVSPDKWVWNSLAHKSLTFNGTSPGGTVTPNQGVGTPSFVAGTSNVLYAGITLEFDVTYAPLCDECPLIQTVIRPYSKHYTATSTFWNAIPN
jgi:hypothetical protein